jgi:Tfp pilus assembly protein PilF
MTTKTFYNIRHEIWICLFLALITFVAYARIGTFEFDNYDTARYIYENRHVKKGLTVEGIRWAFITTHLSNWHPLTWLSHMLDVQLYGLDPGAHHLTNLLFHMANTILLFLILAMMTLDLPPSSFVAALFAVHPLHVQSVAWLAERKDLVCTFFGLLAIWSYLRYVRYPKIVRYLPILFFFILGLMAKPMIVTFPFVLLLLDYWPLKRFQFEIPLQDVSGRTLPTTSVSMISLVMEKIPLFIVAAASCMVTLYAQTSGGAISSLGAYPLFLRIINALVSYAGYVGKMFWPSKLAVFYPYPSVWPMWQIVASGLLVTTTTLLAIRFAKSRPWFIVGWLWYLGTLIPVIGLVQVGAQAMADRYTYVPLIGIFIMISWGLSDLVNRNLIKRRSRALITVVILGVLMSVTWKQVGYWKNSITLFERALEVTENNYVAHNNLGHRLMELGQFNDAIKHYKSALESNPLFETAHLNLGFVYSSQGNLTQAIHHYSKAIKIKPDYAVAYNNLGNALYRLGKSDQAVPNYLKAMRIDPEYAEAYNGLGAALIRLGDIKDQS